MRRIHRMALAMTVAVALTLAEAPAVLPALSAAPATPVLPAPTGRHELGVTELHLVDSDRPDP